ncbi:MAG: carbon-nitrogen hydrolase family protein [Bacteroidales bacterium]|jgi:nitrilase|nr:carbon-nitrogen hydrolase family protein [Bacteroidales bacterium]
MNSTKIAIVQESSIFLNIEKSVQKALKIIKEAADNKPDIVVFGESWFGGYPSWLDYIPNAGRWNYPPIKDVWADTFENAMEIGGKEIETLSEAAKKAGVFLVLGFNEVIRKGRGNGTIYNAILMIDSKGKIRNHHRKLMPTYTEKLVYGLGDANGLNAVETSHGRIGALVCWEHWMPLTRQAMHDEAEDIHFALWPTVHEMHQIASRQYAFEGRCFVISVGQMLASASLPKALIDEVKKTGDKLPEFVLNGGSCVVGPDGSYLMEPQFDIGGILYVDLPSMKTNISERMNLATSGHYQRWDVFDFKINKEREY